jgi:hypothetical protein
MRGGYGYQMRRIKKIIRKALNLLGYDIINLHSGPGKRKEISEKPNSPLSDSTDTALNENQKIFLRKLEIRRNARLHTGYVVRIEELESIIAGNPVHSSR